MLDKPSILIPNVIGGGLSVLGSLFIMATFARSADMRSRPLMRLVVCMSTCVLFNAARVVFPTLVDDINTDDGAPSDGFPCQLEAGLGQFFGLGGVLYSLAIAVSAYKALGDRHIDLDHLRSRERAYHAGIMLYCTVATIALFASPDEIGYTGDGVCWVRKSELGDVFRVTFYLPVVVTMVASVALLVKVVRLRHLFQTYSHRYSKKGSKSAVFWRMVAFTLSFVLLWMFPLGYRLSQTVSESDDTLMLLHRTSLSLQGFANFLVWISSPSFAGFHRLFFICCPCCRSKDDPLEAEYAFEETSDELFDSAISDDDLDHELLRHHITHDYALMTPEDEYAASVELSDGLPRPN